MILEPTHVIWPHNPEVCVVCGKVLLLSAGRSAFVSCESHPEHRSGLVRLCSAAVCRVQFLARLPEWWESEQHHDFHVTFNQ